MIKRPSFPVSRGDASAGQRFDHKLTMVALVLAIIVAAGLLVRYTGPIPATESDPGIRLTGP